MDMDIDAESAPESPRIGSKRTSPSTYSPNNARTRRARHRHTQSLGLLSPIPSRSSLRSDAAADEFEARLQNGTLEFEGVGLGRTTTTRARTPPPAGAGATPTRGGSAACTPQRAAGPKGSNTISTTSSPSIASTATTTTSAGAGTPSRPSTPHTADTHRRARASLPPLPALLASLSALFPGSTPSSPKVADEMPTPTSPTAATDGSSAILSPVAVVPYAPQPRRAPSFTPYQQHPDTPSPRAPQSQTQAQTQTPQRPPSASASRSEQLLRDALRRGSVSASSVSTSSPTSPRPGHKRSSSNTSFSPQHHQHQRLAPGGGAGRCAYGGDSEFSPSHPASHSSSPPASAGASAALSHTLSRLEGRSSPAPVRERDPEHEALRARLERVLALNAAVASGGSPRSSLGSEKERRASSQGAGLDRRTSLGSSQRTSLSASISASASGSSASGSNEQSRAQPVQERDRERTATLTPRPPSSRPRTPLNAHNHNAPGSPRTPTLRSPQTPGDTPRSARRRTVTGGHGGESPHLSPRFQQTHLPHSPHSPLQPSPHYRATSPRPHVLALDGVAELARRHTTPTPTASPRRAQFGLERPASPALSRDGTERGHVRQRARTEPSSTTLAYGVAGEQYGALPEMVGEQRRERERAQGQGHGRKSSAYAALAALSGLGVGHPSSARHHARTGSLNSYAPHLQPTNGPSAGGNGPPTPGSTPPLSADVRDEPSTSESEEGEYEDDSESGHGHRRRTRGGNGKLLTPPATPPRCSLVVVAGSDDGAIDGACAKGCLHPHGGEPRPTFNARKASAQCRQLEGYVSFSAVEGLGEPPSPGPDGDLDDEDTGKRKRGSLGAGIAGFWKSGFW